MAIGPTRTEVHPVDPVLTAFSVAYRNKAENFIATKVFPSVPVADVSGRYFIFGKETFFGESEVRLERAPKSHYARSGYSITTSTYNCIEYGFEEVVDDAIKEAADDPLKPEQTAVRRATDIVLINLEERVATACTTAANWESSVTLSGTDQWSDYAGSDPMGDIRKAIKAIHDQSGFYANTIVLGDETYMYLVNHDQLKGLLPRDAYKTVNEAQLTAILGNAFGIQTVLVGKAKKNVSPPGVEPSLKDIWGKHAFVCYVEPTPTIESATAGYVLTHIDLTVETYREESIRSDIVRVRHKTAEKVVSKL